MMQESKNKISGSDAKELLDRSVALIDFTVTDVLNINTGGDFDKEVIIENCIVENLHCIMVQFHKRVILKNSHFKKASFNFSYFVGGLVIEDCVFEEYVSFDAGGHNAPGNMFILKSNQFQGFVNFFDCWFNSSVSVYDNNFEKGTNLLSNTQLVSFDVPVQVGNNLGDLAVESELR